MSVQDEVDERKGNRERWDTGPAPLTQSQYHACIQTAWQAAAPLWPAWFEVLEAEEEEGRAVSRTLADDAGDE